MPQITYQIRLLAENTMVFLSKGHSDGMWRCRYLLCPVCGYYVFKGEGYDECPCGNIAIDPGMFRVSVLDSLECEVECFDAIPRKASGRAKPEGGI